MKKIVPNKLVRLLLATDCILDIHDRFEDMHLQVRKKSVAFRLLAAANQGVPKEQAAICHQFCPVHVQYLYGICPVQDRTSSGQIASR